MSHRSEAEWELLAESGIGQLHAVRLAGAIKKMTLVSRFLEANEGEPRTELISTVKDGKTFTQEVDITPELHAGIASIVLFEREALVSAGFPEVAQVIAPQSLEKRNLRVIFPPESSTNEAA